MDQRVKVRVHSNSSDQCGSTTCLSTEGTSSGSEVEIRNKSLEEGSGGSPGVRLKKDNLRKYNTETKEMV